MAVLQAKSLTLAKNPKMSKFPLTQIAWIDLFPIEGSLRLGLDKSDPWIPK